jgi:hypothetical protein
VLSKPSQSKTRSKLSRITPTCANRGEASKKEEQQPKSATSGAQKDSKVKEAEEVGGCLAMKKQDVRRLSAMGNSKRRELNLDE